MKKRIITLALACILSISTCVPALAMDRKTNDDMHIVENANGMFDLLNNSAFLSGGSEFIAVKTIDGTGDIFSNNSNDQLYMRVNENSMVCADAIEFDPSDVDDLNSKIEKFGISEETANDLRALAKTDSEGLCEIKTLTVYIPAENDIQTRGTETKTRLYIGFNQRTYYEELVVFSGNSLEFNLNAGVTVSKYIDNVMMAAAKTLLNTGLDAATGGSWTIASIFMQSAGYSTVQTKQANNHTAKLIENKTRKRTYLVDGADKFIGSILDNATSYHFENVLNIDGWGSLRGADSPKQTYAVYGWIGGDKLAYQNYLNGPYIDTISAYKYMNGTKGETVLVNSLLQ